MGGHGHGHDDHDDDEHETGEWMQLLKPSELREVQEFDRARKEVERQIIHSNQAKLAGRSEAERRGRTPSSYRIAGAGVASNDVMSHIYSQDVDVEHLAKLLPRPGDGEKQNQLAWQKILDAINSFLTGPFFGIVTILVTGASVCLYLYETTLDYNDDKANGGGWYKSGHRYPSWFTGVEDALLAIFGAELVLRSVLADHHYSFWVSTQTVVDILSILPSLLLVAFDLRLWGFLRFLRFLRWPDIATLVDHRRTKLNAVRDDEGVGSETDDAAKKASEWKHQSILAALRLLAFVARFVLVYAGAVLLLDRAEGGIEDISASDPSEPLEFTSALYMAAMMLSTVGEGGHGPVAISPFARVCTSIAVLVFLPLAAIRVADVIKISDPTRSTKQRTSLSPVVRERHVVVCGSISAGNLKARLQELFHADHGKHNVRWVKVVVLSPEPPSSRMKSLISRPRYRGRVTFIQGSPLEDESLRKARVDDAAAVMVLANKTPRSSHAEDMNLSLQAISITNHVQLERRQGLGPRVLVELVDPNAALHLQAAGLKHVVSSAQLKLSILGQSCLCPGWSAVVANLLESRAAIPPQALQQGSWLAEYYVGAKKTFYSVEFSPAFEGVFFADAVVHIFERFELVLAAVETKQFVENGKDGVLVNPSDDFCIGKGDRGFILAESWADARVIWDYLVDEGRGGVLDERGNLKSRSRSPEEEEALALETVGTSDAVALGPQAFVDSMLFSRTLIHCQKRLPDGEVPDVGLILEWARQFQESEALSDEMVVTRILASAGLVLPHNLVLSTDAPLIGRNTTAATTPAAAAAAFNGGYHDHDDYHDGEGEGEEKDGETVKAAAADLLDLSAVEDSAAGAGSSSRHPAPTPASRDQAAEEVPQSEGLSRKGSSQEDKPSSLPHGAVSRSAVSAPRRASSSVVGENGSVTGFGSNSGGDDFKGEEILSALRTMDVSSLSGEEACRRLLALRSAAKAAPPPSPAPRPADVAPPPSPAPGPADGSSSPSANTKKHTKSNTNNIATPTAAPAATAAVIATNPVRQAWRERGAGALLAVTSRRRILTARHLVGHVVVLGFPSRPSHLECFLRPLKGWTGGAGVGGGRELGGGGVPVVLVAQNLEQLESALAVVDRNGHVNSHGVYLLEGSPVSQADLENAGVSTAKCVIVMKDPRSRMVAEGILGDPLRDAETLLSFIKMEDGLLTPNQHVVVELESSSNVRFLHTRTEARTLKAIAGLGGAGSGGASDEAHYLWPKYAAGMTYNASSVDSMFAQAFYRPSRIALVQRLLLLDRWEGRGRSGIAQSSAARGFVAASTVTSIGPGGEESSVAPAERECCLRQMSVPPTFLGHSFGEMFQHLAAPPLRCVAFALLRARGTRNAPEPYVYTGPRADTVLHRGDKVFVLGKPPILS